MASMPVRRQSSSKSIALTLSVGMLVAAGIAFPLNGASSTGTSPSGVDLGSAVPYSVLAATTSTNAATAAGRTPTHLSGDLGVYPGTSLTGFAKVDSGPGIVDGKVDSPSAPVTSAAQDDAATAYLDAQGRAGTILSASTFQLGGHTYSPGVYSAGTSLDITGTVTLDGGGNPNAVFIFQAGSTLVTAAGSPSIPASTVALTNGTQAANVFWQVGSSATLGTYSFFSGTVLALTSITATTGAAIDGRLIALNAAVTLDTNNINTQQTVTVDTTAPTLTITGAPTVTTTVTTPTITGTSDELGATVTVTITDTNGLQTLTGIVDANGDWTVSTPVDLDEGPHTVTAVVGDEAGNSTTTTQTMTVDTNAPTLTITGGADVTTSDTTPTFTGTSDELGATVTVTITDSTGIQTLTTVVDANGDWTVTTPVNLDEGPHTVTAVVYDDAGNSTTTTQTVTVDTTAPTLTITGGTDVTTTVTTPTITGTSDELGATVTVTITDTNGLQTLTGIVDANGDWTVTTPVDLDEGRHTVTAVVDDDAGNSTTTTQTVTVETTQMGGESSGSGSNSAPTIWTNGATPIESNTSSPHVGKLPILATTTIRGSTWWLAPASLGEEQEHELIPDGDEVYFSPLIPVGAQ